jgi:hypothetical protein
MRELEAKERAARRALSSTRRPPSTPLARPTLPLHSDPRGFAGRPRRWLLFVTWTIASAGARPGPLSSCESGVAEMRARGSTAHAVTDLDPTGLVRCPLSWTSGILQPAARPRMTIPGLVDEGAFSEHRALRSQVPLGQAPPAVRARAGRHRKVASGLF